MHTGMDGVTKHFSYLKMEESSPSYKLYGYGLCKGTPTPKIAENKETLHFTYYWNSWWDGGSLQKLWVRFFLLGCFGGRSKNLPKFPGSRFFKGWFTSEPPFSKFSGFSHHPKGRLSSCANFQRISSHSKKSTGGFFRFLTFAGESQLFFPFLPCFQTLLWHIFPGNRSDLVSRFVSFLIQAWLTLPKNEWLIHQKPWWVFERGTYSLSAPLFRLNLFGRFSGLIFPHLFGIIPRGCKKPQADKPFFWGWCRFFGRIIFGMQKTPAKRRHLLQTPSNIFFTFVFCKKNIHRVLVTPKKRWAPKPKKERVIFGRTDNASYEFTRFIWRWPARGTVTTRPRGRKRRKTYTVLRLRWRPTGQHSLWRQARAWCLHEWCCGGMLKGP